MEPPLSVCQRLLRAAEDDDGGDQRGGPWRVLTAEQRLSLRQRGFVVVDEVAPRELVAEAYEEVGVGWGTCYDKGSSFRLKRFLNDGAP